MLNTKGFSVAVQGIIRQPFAQLTIYALALSQLTGIPLFDFKCAWFNEEQYCEFFPRTILKRNVEQQRAA